MGDEEDCQLINQVSSPSEEEDSPGEGSMAKTKQTPRPPRQILGQQARRPSQVEEKEELHQEETDECSCTMTSNCCRSTM